MFSSIFSKEDKRNLSTTMLINDDSIDTSTHSSFEEVSILEKVAPILEMREPKLLKAVCEPEPECDIIINNSNNSIIENENKMFNPFFDMEETLLKLADKHNQIDEELNKLLNPNKILLLKQTAIAEIIKIVSLLPSHTHDSEGAIISATLLINDTLERILTIYYNKHYKFLNSFQKKTNHFSLNINNNCVLSNLKLADKEVLDRIIERLILEGQTDYYNRQHEPLFYTNVAEDRYFIKRDQIVVAILKIFSLFVKNLLDLIPNLSFEEENLVIPTEQDKINNQIDMIFEPIQEPFVSTKRRSKRRG